MLTKEKKLKYVGAIMDSPYRHGDGVAKDLAALFDVNVYTIYNWYSTYERLKRNGLI